MAIVRWNPWNDLFSLHSQMDRLFNESFADMHDFATSGFAVLPVDVKRSEDTITVRASVPGLQPDDVEITFDNGILSIRGEQNEDADMSEGEWLRRERHISAFERQLTLPAEVNIDNVSAAFENGVLTVTLPLSQKTQPRKIPVMSPIGGTHKVIEQTGKDK